MTMAPPRPELPLSAPSTFDVSVVIPVYGGEKTIGPLVEGLAEVFEANEERWEVILVCDRPRDDSWTVARELAERFETVSAVRLLRNFGQHPATLLGIRRARGRTIMTMDEDLQHDPKDVPAVLAASRERTAIAYGTFQEPRHGLWRNLTSKLTKWFLARYVGPGIANHATAFRAFPAELREAFATYRGERVAIDVLLSWSGAPIHTVPCRHAPRAAGESGYTFKKLVGYLADLLVGYSIAPLRLASSLGLLTVVLALALAVWVVIAFVVFGREVPGFAFTAVSIAVFAGVQLLALGVIGEYLGRLYFDHLGRPQYLVAEVVEVAGQSDPGAPGAERGTVSTSNDDGPSSPRTTTG